MRVIPPFHRHIAIVGIIGQRVEPFPEELPYRILHEFGRSVDARLPIRCDVPSGVHGFAVEPFAHTPQRGAGQSGGDREPAVVRALLERGPDEPFAFRVGLPGLFGEFVVQLPVVEEPVDGVVEVAQWFSLVSSVSSCRSVW